MLCEHAAARILQICAVLRKLQGLEHWFQISARPRHSSLSREGEGVASHRVWLRPIDELRATSSRRLATWRGVIGVKGELARRKKGAWGLFF